MLFVMKLNLNEVLGRNREAERRSKRICLRNDGWLITLRPRCIFRIKPINHVF